MRSLEGGSAASEKKNKKKWSNKRGCENTWNNGRGASGKTAFSRLLLRQIKRFLRRYCKITITLFIFKLIPSFSIFFPPQINLRASQQLLRGNGGPFHGEKKQTNKQKKINNYQIAFAFELTASVITRKLSSTREAFTHGDALPRRRARTHARMHAVCFCVINNEPAALPSPVTPGPHLKRRRSCIRNECGGNCWTGSPPQPATPGSTFRSTGSHLTAISTKKD